MIEELSPVRGIEIVHTPPPNRIWFKGAATPFIVHGHRLSSLFRLFIPNKKPFIVLKILKSPRVNLNTDFEYLWNNEASGSKSDA